MDYTELLAPVVKLTSGRMVLSVAAVKNLHLPKEHAMTGFLNGDSDCQGFMEQTLCYKQDDRAEFACWLKKALYGLKQASQQWFAETDRLLCDGLGLIGSSVHDCLHVKETSKNTLIVTPCVEDMKIACNDKDQLAKKKLKFCSNFKSKDVGESCMLLGVKICRNIVMCMLAILQLRYLQIIIETVWSGI